MAGLMYTRFVGTQSGYSGIRSELPNYQYQPANESEAIDPGLQIGAHSGTQSDVVVIASTLQDESKKISQSLSYILSQMLSGSAHALVVSCKGGKGLEQWTRQCRREELDSDSGAARVAQLHSLLVTSFSGKWEKYIKELTSLTLNLQRYEERDTDHISADLIQALTKNNTLEPLNTQVDMHTFTISISLRSTIWSYVQQHVSSSAHGCRAASDDPMDIKAYGQDKSGKSKSKKKHRGHDCNGKSKGYKGKPNKRGKAKSGANNI